MNITEIQSIQSRLSEWLHEMQLVQYCHYSAANHSDSCTIYLVYRF